MKDLRLPIMSEEDRQKAWNNLKPNDKLACITWDAWSNSYCINQVTVVKKTAKGSIRLDNGELLKGFYSQYHIITNELIEWSKKIQLEKEVMMLLSKADRDKKSFKSNLDYEDAVKLKEILERIIQAKK